MNSAIMETIKERIPSAEECQKLMIRYCMLPNIIEHSWQVMRVAIFIIDNLKNDVKINRELVTAAALLHDITKTKALITKEHHDISGGELLRFLGFPSVANVVEQHIFLRNLNLQGRLEESEIIYYADKRVLHDRIVSLQQRVEDMIARYGVSETVIQHILQNARQAARLEKKIVGLMTTDIETLNNLSTPSIVTG